MKPITRREAIKRSGRLLLGAAACSLAPGFAAGCSSREVDQDVVSRLMQHTQPANLGNIRLSVIYNNVPYDKELRTDWGFACLVEGLDKTILFDAGRYDDLFVSNLSRLQIDPQKIDQVFLSHDHPDHIGGVMKVLGMRNEITVALVKSFPWGFKRAVKKYGAEVKEIDLPSVISRNCLSTGEMSSVVKNEHGLIILTDRGAIVLTGCAHPGVVEIVEHAKAITSQNVLLVAGGFHLLMDDAASIREKVVRLNELGVRYVAPSHCSGGEAMKIFAGVYGDRFIDSGVGRIITATDFV